MEAISDSGPVKWFPARELTGIIPALDRDQAAAVLAAARSLRGPVLSVHGFDIEYSAERAAWAVMAHQCDSGRIK